MPELRLGNLPYHPIPKVQTGPARLTSAKARHRQLQPASSQETLLRACESTFFCLRQEPGHRVNKLLVKERAEPGPSAVKHLGEGTMPLRRAEQKSHTTPARCSHCWHEASQGSTEMLKGASHAGSHGKGTVRAVLGLRSLTHSVTTVPLLVCSDLHS